MNEQEDTIVRFNLHRPIHGRSYPHLSPSDGHNRTMSSSTSSPPPPPSSPPPQPPSPSSLSIQMGRSSTKPNPKFLAFFLQALVMAVVISLFFLFVGIAAIVLIHIAIAGRAIHRRRYRRSSSAATLVTDSFEDDLDFGGVGFGLSHRDLRKLPTFYCRSGDESYSGINRDCSVCLDGFRDGDRCRILPKCKHVFHANCVDSWLIRVPACPVCRGTVDPKVEQKHRAPTSAPVRCRSPIQKGGRKEMKK